MRSPWYVFLAAKARRLSGCREENMFIGFTAVTDTSRMSWECKHRQLDIPFLTTSHSSPTFFSSRGFPISYLLMQKCGAICTSSGMILQTNLPHTDSPPFSSQMTCCSSLQISLHPTSLSLRMTRSVKHGNSATDFMAALMRGQPVW